MSNLRHDNALWSKARGLDKTVAILTAGQPVLLATVETRDGGAWRLVTTGAGRFLDATEGGLLEARIADRAGQLAETATACALWEGEPLGPLTGDQAAVYGGIVRLALIRLDPDPAVLAPLTALAQALAAGTAGTLVCRLSGPAAGHPTAVPVGAPAVGPALPAALAATAERLAREDGGLTVVAADGQDYLLDPHRPLPLVVFAGAGQVSRLAVPLAREAGFRTVALDDDPAFANRERFPLADLVRVVPAFADCFAGLGVDGDTSLVIATRGHAHDATALAQALATGAGYVGMMGCKADGRARVDGLARQGVATETLARVHTPIGLPIGGQSAAEIALSIVAECVANRSARRRLSRLAPQAGPASGA